MSESIELSDLDLRYEGHRLRNDGREARLLASIAERGVEEPLCGVDTPQGRLLLDGFKRLRCCRRLGIGQAAYVSLGPEEATGILRLMRASKDKALDILEEARFVVDLLTLHQMSTAEVAEKLSRSKSWVSMRRTLIEEMGEEVQQLLFRGAFPVYSYLYTLRPFRRMNGANTNVGRTAAAPRAATGTSAARSVRSTASGPPPTIERFMTATSGKRLSVRDIELLAQGYFRGPAALREAIDAGNLVWSLDRMKSVPADPEGLGGFERALIGDLEILVKYLQRVTVKCQDRRPRSRAFYAQANLLVGGLLVSLEPFQECMREFHDRSGSA